MKFKDFMNNNQLVDLPQNREAEFRVSVHAIIENNDSILLIKDGRSEQGLEFPGGGIELGQTPQEALIREIREETGYDLDENSIDVINVSSENYYHGKRDRYFCGISITFTAQLESEKQHELQLDSPDEIDEVKWVKTDKLLKENIAKYHQDSYQKYLEKQSKNAN